MFKFNEWREKIIEKNNIKTYTHLDAKIDIENDANFELIKKKIMSLNQHQFLPFIKRTERFYKLRRGICTCGNLATNNCTFNCHYRRRIRSLKERPLMYSSHLDSYIYSYYNHILSEKYEEFLLKASLENIPTAYRKIEKEGSTLGNKCNIHFAKEAFSQIKNFKEPTVITSDISSFFDELDHKHLENEVKRVIDQHIIPDRLYKIQRSLTRFKYIDYEDDFCSDDIQKYLKYKKSNYKIFKVIEKNIKKNKTNKGIPQGSPISGLLSNIYMLSFDESIGRNNKIFYRRYSDDIFIICERENCFSVLKCLQATILQNKLRIEPHKTNISHFKRISSELICTSVLSGDLKPKRRKYVDYLGFEYDGKNILMRKASLGKLRVKQEKKAKKRVYNTSYNYKKKSSKSMVKSKYLKTLLLEFKDPKLDRQVKTLSKRRNLKRKETANTKAYYDNKYKIS